MPLEFDVRNREHRNSAGWSKFTWVAPTPGQRRPAASEAALAEAQELLAELHAELEDLLLRKEAASRAALSSPPAHDELRSSLMSWLLVRRTELEAEVSHARQAAEVEIQQAQRAVDDRTQQARHAEEARSLLERPAPLALPASPPSRRFPAPPIVVHAALPPRPQRPAPAAPVRSMRELVAERPSRQHATAASAPWAWTEAIGA